MAQTNLNVRINKEDKKNFENFCNETGMNVSVAINMFVKAVIREKKLPFEVKADSFCCESNTEYLKEVVQDINNGRAKFIEHDIIDD